MIRSETVEFTTAKDWITYMYGEAKGLITRATMQPEFRQWHFDGTSIMDQVFDAVNNVYVSMNTFFRTYRRREYLKKLNALYMDIDCYKEGYTKEQVLMALRCEVIGNTIPEPTFIIDSGRGLYLIWKINEDVKALPRWERVMKYLYKQTKEYGADSSVVEPCRILRVPFSVNGTSGTPVKILSFYDRTYTLYEIIKEYEITEYKEGKARKREKPAGKLGGIQPKDQWEVLTKDQREMLINRINDLNTLYGWRIGPDCRRENALFLIRHWHYRLTGDKGYALQKTLEFNARLDTPHDEEYVISRTASAEKRKYRFSNAKLIEFLQITGEEVSRLSSIKPTDKEAKREQKRERNHKNYLDRLSAEGAQPKAESVAERRAALAVMLGEGRSRAEICGALGISESTYKRDKAMLGVANLKEKAVAAVKGAAQSLVGETNRQEQEEQQEEEQQQEEKSGSKIQPPYYREQRSCSGPIDFISKSVHFFRRKRSKKFYFGEG